MTPNTTPRDPLPPATAAAMAQLHAWEQLRDELQRLHAELEYLRVMMKVSGGTTAK